MPTVIAHLGHWYESMLFAAPMAVIGAVLWRSAKKERLAAERGEEDGWDGEDEWIDPRLSDDETDDRF